MAKPQENYDFPTSALLSGCRSVRPDRLKKVPYYNTHTTNSVGLSTLRQPVMRQLFNKILPNTNSLHLNFSRL